MANIKKATAEDMIALADEGLTPSQIATRLNTAQLRTERHKLWYWQNTVAWFDRIPDEHIAKHWPSVMDALKKARAKARRASRPRRAKKSQVCDPAIAEALAKSGGATITMAKPETKGKATEQGAVVTVMEDGRAVVMVTESVVRAQEIVLTSAATAGVRAYGAMPLSAVAAYLGTLHVTALERIG